MSPLTKDQLMARLHRAYMYLGSSEDFSCRGDYEAALKMLEACADEVNPALGILQGEQKAGSVKEKA